LGLEIFAYLQYKPLGLNLSFSLFKLASRLKNL